VVAFGEHGPFCSRRWLRRSAGVMLLAPTSRPARPRRVAKLRRCAPHLRIRILGIASDFESHPLRSQKARGRPVSVRRMRRASIRTASRLASSASTRCIAADTASSRLLARRAPMRISGLGAPSAGAWRRARAMSFAEMVAPQRGRHAPRADLASGAPAPRREAASLRSASPDPDPRQRLGFRIPPELLSGRSGSLQKTSRQTESGRSPDAAWGTDDVILRFRRPRSADQRLLAPMI